jgi:hypothetical protein
MNRMNRTIDFFDARLRLAFYTAIEVFLFCRLMSFYDSSA